MSQKFIFESYHFADGTAEFRYRYDDIIFQETVTFADASSDYDEAALERALFLAFILIGTSYYKAFPTRSVELAVGGLDAWQVAFFDAVYQEGLSQFAYENQLTRDDLAHFEVTGVASRAVAYTGQGSLVFQSGGKDSLLLATLLCRANHEYTPWYLSSTAAHPAVLDQLAQPLVSARRQLDRSALTEAASRGGLGGHVPVTYIVQSLAIIQAILLGRNQVLAAIGHEGEEPHAQIGDLAVTHQWSKTWSAEQQFAEYVTRYISPDIQVGSPLRQFSELKIAERFVALCWQKYGQSFSSCNVANYRQGADNQALTWCGRCPKCANSYLLFAPFVEPTELQDLFHGDLYQVPELTQTFKGLLGIDDVMKPFECVGEIDELRLAYHRSQRRGYASLVFAVPVSSFDIETRYPANPRLISMLQYDN